MSFLSKCIILLWQYTNVVYCMFMICQSFLMEIYFLHPILSSGSGNSLGFNGTSGISCWKANNKKNVEECFAAHLISLFHLL